MNSNEGTRTNDPREAPAYPLVEAARYVRVAPATLRTWVVGRPYPTRSETKFFRPLIQLPDSGSGFLSFNNLIEAHVLRALRSEHRVSIRSVREALTYAETEFRIDRLLLRQELTASAGELFLDRYGHLVNISRSGQIAMRKVLETYLERVDWAKSFPTRLYPFLTSDPGQTRPISIDASVAFGRPVVVRRGISTAVIAQRIDAGESIEGIAADYDLERNEVEEAVVYERAA